MTKPLEKKEPLLIKLIAGVFLAIPLGIAKSYLILVSRIGKKKVEMIALVIPVLLSAASILGLSRLLDVVNLIFQSGIADPNWQGGVRFCLVYVIYIFVSMPVFLIVAHFNPDTKFSKSEDRQIEPDQRTMRRNRLKSDYHKIYLGESFKRGQSVYLTNDQRQMHCEVVGSTGTGKTESVLLPMLAHDVAHGKGAIILDGKGDLELLNRILYIVKTKNRQDDFFFFSLAHPDKSNTYNPLYRGNPTELKDKLINSMAWTEEFYRRMAERAALTLFNAIQSRKRKKTSRFRDLHAYLSDINALSKLNDETTDPVLKEDIGKMVDSFKDNQKFLSGLMADLYLTSRSEFSDLLDTLRPEIDLLRVYEKKQIVYFALDLQKYADTSRRIGRMIIQDIRAVSSHIQAKIPEHRRHFFPVFVDDASSFLDLNFIDFLNKCRASGFAITILHQSLGDLVFKGMSNFQQQVVENTNIKIVLRQDDPWSVEKFTKIGGTRRTMISTYQTEDKMLGKGFTGTGSVREGQTFRVEPDLIRGLKRGEAVLIWKSPSLLTDYIKLDFFGHPAYTGEFEPNRNPDAFEDEELSGETKRPKKSQTEDVDTTKVENPLEVIKEVRNMKKKTT